MYARHLQMKSSEFLVAGPADASWTVVLAHGAGQGMVSRFMGAIAEGLWVRGQGFGGLQVVRFEFPFMRSATDTGRKRPPDREPVLLASWRDVIASLETRGCPRQRLIVGGKSLGGRIASMIADEQAVAGLVCLGYPFHPPTHPERLRTTQLVSMKTPTLICQGERDPFGNRAEVSGYKLSPAVKLYWLRDGDHGFKPRKISGISEAENWNRAVQAVVVFIATLAIARA